MVAVYVAADLEPVLHDHRADDEPPGRERPFRLLAEGDVRCVGESLAMVVADSRYHAEDAVDLIDVEIDVETPVLDYETAMDPDAPLVHPDMASNVYADFPSPGSEELDAVLAAAPIVLTETFRQHRYLTVPMETRGIVAHWDPRPEALTVWISTQGPHGVRAQMARALGVEDSAVRVLAPDTGGAFGLKMHPGPEELCVALASKLLGRPVKWIQDRRENLMADEHPREDQATVTMAADEDGILLGASVDFLESTGSFPSPGGSAAIFTAMLFPGPYRLTPCTASARSVMTNTRGRGAYRGPWMFETVARELMIDRVAAGGRPRPPRAASAQRAAGRGPPLDDADGHDLRPDDGARQPRAGRRDDRLRRAAGPAGRHGEPRVASSASASACSPSRRRTRSAG